MIPSRLLIKKSLDSMVGSLMFCCTRPTVISTPYQRLSRKVHDPRWPHLSIGAKRALRNLIAGDSFKMVWLTVVLTAARLPFMGTPTGECFYWWFVWLANGATVEWRSELAAYRRAIRTCENEYVAAGEATNEILLYPFRAILRARSWQHCRKKIMTHLLWQSMQIIVKMARLTATSERKKHSTILHYGTSCDNSFQTVNPALGNYRDVWRCWQKLSRKLRP